MWIGKVIFIPLNSVYTIGKINKSVKIWTSVPNDYKLSLNVHPFKLNRWKIDIDGKKINGLLLPQNEDSIEIPVVFTNKNKVEENDIILFKINFNSNGTINNNKPLLPIEKITSHINDYTDVINILESKLTKQELLNFNNF